MKNLFLRTAFLLIVFFFFSGVLAQAIKPMCKEGILPKSLRGIYSTKNSNGDNVLSQSRWDLDYGYFDLKSCVVNGKRVVTLSDTDEVVMNLTVTRVDKETIKMTNMESGDDEILSIVKR